MNIELTEKEQNYLIRVLEQNYADLYEDYEGGKYHGFNNSIKHQLYLKLFGRVPYELSESIHKDGRIAHKTTGQKSGVLSMGNGYYSTMRINELHKRLNYASMVLSGQQQNGGQGTEFNEESDRQDQESLQDVMKDFLISFGVSPEELIEPKLEFDI